MSARPLRPAAVPEVTRARRPGWALVIIAADVVALWGLCAYGSRENLEAV